MKQSTIEKALLATARVACCASLIGLGCTDGKNYSDTADTSLQDCENLVSQSFLLGNRANRDTKECCQRIAEYYDEHFIDLQDWDKRNECCEALDWEGSMACTPWGPPTPPATMA